MIIRADILGKCIDDYIEQYEELVFPVPFGIPWSQKQIETVGKKKSLLFVCGRYEGIDYRIYDYYAAHYSVSYFSIGDYIMCGGELPAMVMIESLIRTHLLRPSVVQEESFGRILGGKHRLLESPQYTRPENWRDLEVPKVLLSGNHKNIAQWKHQQSLIYTEKYRPDLLESFE
jgi:tRNA (guanine37-N1)-methyltransferase